MANYDSSEFAEREKSCLCKRFCKKIDIKSEELLTRERIAKELEAMIIEDSNPDKQSNGKYYS